MLLWAFVVEILVVLVSLLRITSFVQTHSAQHLHLLHPEAMMEALFPYWEPKMVLLGNSHQGGLKSHEAMQANRTTNSRFFPSCQMRTTANGSCRTLDQSNLPRFQYIIENSHETILNRIRLEWKSKLDETITKTIIHSSSCHTS